MTELPEAIGRNGTRLHVGYLLPTRDHILAGGGALEPLLDQARLAETLGFDSVWAGESPLTRPRPDPLLVLSAVAAVTTRLTLGTAVLLPALRHPILLAHQLATLDRLCEGRLVAGMGAAFPNSATKAQFAALDVTFSRRVSRLEESIEAMRLLWSGCPVSFRGEHFSFDEIVLAPAPARRGGPPIWLAGGGPGLGRVARLADGWLPYPPLVADYARDLAAIREHAVRPVTPALYATLCLDEDPERARQRLRASIERYYNAPLEAVEKVQAMFAGRADDAVRWLRSYVAAGARQLVLRLASDDHAAALAEAGDRVLPALRRTAAPER